MQVPSGSIERGERTIVIQAYLGDLTISAVAGGKAKQSLENGARLTDCQKSDQLIVATKPVKNRRSQGADKSAIAGGETRMAQEVKQKRGT